MRKLTLFVGLLFSLPACLAEVWDVIPGQSIQTAIDAAGYGDTVHAAAGTYVERIHLKDGVRVIGTGSENCILDGNQEGTVVIASNCDPNTVLEGFTITRGSGVYGGGMTNTNGSPTVRNCMFRQNSAFFGGGMYNGSFEGYPVITNCTFIENSADTGGGIQICLYTFPTVSGCTFIGNTALYRGGGIEIQEGFSWITDCIFLGNTANAGGGIANRDLSHSVINNCIFRNNTAHTSGGGIYNRGGSRPIITNCTLSGNTAGSGGGICNSEYSRPTVTNSILWNNGASSGNEIDNAFESFPMITYSDVAGCGGSGAGWDGSLGTDGGGNIDADPLFSDPNDVHLKSQAGRWEVKIADWVTDEVTSLCIDAGDPAGPIGAEPFPNGGLINMGAYGGAAQASNSYFGRAPCRTTVAGDINGDCVIDLKDFTLLTVHWLEDYR